MEANVDGIPGGDGVAEAELLGFDAIGLVKIGSVFHVDLDLKTANFADRCFVWFDEVCMAGHDVRSGFSDGGIEMLCEA